MKNICQQILNMMNSHEISNESVCKMRWNDEYKSSKSSYISFKAIKIRKLIVQHSS